MSTTRRGITSLQYGPDFNLVRDRQGVWRGTQNMFLRKEDLANAPSPGTVHPEFDFLSLDELTVSHDGGQVMELVGSYIGASIVEIDSEEQLDVVPEYSVETTLAESPIEQADYYSSLSGDDAAEARSYAEQPPRDEEGLEFLPLEISGWSSLKQDLLVKIQKGFDAFRDPRVTFSETKLVKALPALTSQGKVDTPPGPVPTVAAGRNWLAAGYSARQRAGDKFWEITRKWDLSGDGGWDTDIY